MTLDGRAQPVYRTIVNDKPNLNDRDCPCGGVIYSLSSSSFARCSNGEIRCLRCLREAKRFGRRGFTCGPGCSSA